MHEGPKSKSHAHNEVVHFWEYMESILDVDGNNQDKVNSSLVSYIKRASDSYKEYIIEEQDLYRVALILIDSKMFKISKEYCLGKLLSLLNIDLLEINLRLIIDYIILCEIKANCTSLDIILQYQGFTVIYNNLYGHFAYLNQYGTEKIQNIYNEDFEHSNFTDIEYDIIDILKKVSTVLMDILFQIFKYSKCELTNIQMIDDFFVYFLMNTILPDMLEDLFNDAKFKLLLALNEQYVIFYSKYKLKNKIYENLLNQVVSKNFIALLFLKFNRITDRSLQIMICKVIYLVLTDEPKISMNFFYLNDLNVFIDVLIRILTNISDHDDEVLRNTFLRVLFPLLKNTELSNTHYRKHDLIQVLEYLSVSDKFCQSDTITPEQQTTQELATKCLLEINWLCDNSEKYIANNTHNSTLTVPTVKLVSNMLKTETLDLYTNEHSPSNKSIERVLTAPPPPPSRKVSAAIKTGTHII